MNINYWIKENLDSLVNDIITLVNIPSVSEKSDNPEMPFGRNCKDALDAALNIASAMGFECFCHENYCGTLLWKGEIDAEIGIFGHLDVVPAGDGWEYEPYNAIFINDLIIGRGSADNKGSILSALYTLKYLKEIGFKPYHSIRLFFGCNEEDGMKDIEYYLKNYTTPKFSFTPDAMFPICNGEKGIMEIELTCSMNKDSNLVDFCSGLVSNAVPSEAYAVIKISSEDINKSNILNYVNCITYLEYNLYKFHMSGIAAHAAFPEGSESAAVKLADALLKSDMLLDDFTESFMKKITSIFRDYYGEGLDVPFEDSVSGKLTHIGGMSKVVDGVFCQNINIRYNINADRKLLVENIDRLVRSMGFDMKIIRDSKPSYMDKNNEIIKMLVDIVNKHIGAKFEPYVMGGGTYARMLENAVGFGPGNPLDSKIFGIERGNGHQPDEYISINTLENAIKIYSEAIVKIDAKLIENS